MWPGGQGAVLELTLQLQQAERDQLLRDQGIEKPAVEGSEDYLGLGGPPVAPAILGMAATSYTSIPIR
jgi:hypothetical protein